MNKKKIILIILTLMCFNFQFLISEGIIIDHRHANLESINPDLLKNILSKVRVGYQHTSHGSQLVTGMQALKEYSKGYDFSYSDNGFKMDVFFNDYAMPETPDLGGNGDLSWAKTTSTEMGNKSNNRNVIMWSWCGGVSNNTEEGILTYLNAMDKLEKDFPNVYFVYMTGHLDGTGENGNLHLMNELIRKYCIENNKILFDFADIESYAPGINHYLVTLNANDACEIDSDNDGIPDKNWAEIWIKANPNNELSKISNMCENCAHSHILNCTLKGIATWNLLAKIAELIDETSSVEDTLSSNKDDIVVFPNPANDIVNIKINAKKEIKVSIDMFDISGSLIKELNSNQVQNEGEKVYTFKINDLPASSYELRIKIDGIVHNKRFVKN